MQMSIHKAAKTGNMDQVKAHINAGRDVNERNIYGKTPLGVALQFSQKEESFSAATIYCCATVSCPSSG